MDLEAHNNFMALALKLAERGDERTKPNPKVGALIVKDGNLVSTGYHIEAGKGHAEVIAIEKAGNDAKGGTLYVTLEPCAHYSKTPPCVDLIIKSGIKQVVIACRDPNPQVNGKGLDELRANNIDIVENILHEQAKELNVGFFSRMSTGMPYVRSKIASSIDGKTSLMNSESKWITSDHARKDVQKWRKQACAIITGSGTANNDNPRLNVRSSGPNEQPYRVILDTHLSINLNAQILKQKKVIIAFSDDPNNKYINLQRENVQLMQLPLNDGFIDLNSLMIELADLECNDILVESGPTLNGRLLEQNFINEIILYLAPIIMGGKANSMFHNPVLQSMQKKINLKQKDSRYIGDNLRLVLEVLQY